MSEFDKDVGTTPGLLAWRIEKLKPTPVQIKPNAHLYDGDAYIFLKTVQTKAALKHDLFFWLGDECSQDEQGAAAYKAVELDELLGGAPVQHRETQNHESDLFLQNFKSVTYKKGGVDSAFNKVERDVYETELLQVKGTRVPRTKPVPLAAGSLNAGDVFILDAGLTIYLWNGSEANRKEKVKGLEVATAIKDDERGGRAELLVYTQGGESDDFWAALGGKGAVKPAVPDDTPAAQKGAVKLLKVSDASGKLETTAVAEGVLHRSMLDSSDVFIVDNEAAIYVWIGKDATAEERKGGMAKATEYLGGIFSSRPKNTRVVKVSEGAEPVLFCANFATWSDGLPAADFSASPRSAVAGAVEQDSADDVAAKMKASRLSLVATPDVDDASGSAEMLRIEDFKAVPVSPDTFGQFFAGDSYIVKYTYEQHGKENVLLYFWLGKDSTADEKGAAALIATEMDDAMGGAATQVRVPMGKEPSHFLKIFGGKMVIHSGGKASGFKNLADEDDYDDDGTSLFHVRGATAASTRAVQVREEASALNSGDCFLLLSPKNCYLWKGSAASPAEYATAKAVAPMVLPKTVKEIDEGSEPDAFWKALGGKAPYATAKELPEMQREPQLFQASNATGKLVVDPVFDFCQADLDEADVFILDVYTTIFLWIGSEANEAERAAAAEAAEAYKRSVGYDASTPVVTVKSGREPMLFTANFIAWDPSAKRTFADPYEARVAALMAKHDAEAPAVPDRSSFVDPLAAKEEKVAAERRQSLQKEEAPAPAATPPPAAVAPGETIPYDTLKSNPPAGIDLAKKESYLSDAEFGTVFGMSKADFEALKAWKQQGLKKQMGLF